MWFLEQMDPENAVYNQLNAFKLKGPLDVNALKSSFNQVLIRHESLRTNLGFIDGQLYQLISDPKDMEMPIVNLSDLSPDLAIAEAGNLAVREAIRPFDLEKEPLIRTFVVKLSAEEHMLIFITHHSIFDGWSVSILINDLATLYDSFMKGLALPPMHMIQYADYAQWQREKLDQGDFEPQISYWKDRLKGDLSLLELPTDHPRPLAQSFKGAVYTRVLSSSLVDSLKALARRERATMFVVLLSAYDVLMHRYTGQEDIVVGCPIAGRTHRELEGLVGLLVNTLPIRASVTDGITFVELVRQLRKTSFEAYDHQDLPFEKLVESLSLNRLPSYTPVFQTLLLLRNFPDPRVDRSGITWERYDFDYTTAKFDLTLELTELSAGLQCRFEYPPALFDESTIARMADHWEMLLRGIASDPERTIGDLPLLTEEEKHCQLVLWNKTKTTYPRDLPVHRIFESLAKATPNAVAIIHNSETISYGMLNARANKLARYLKTLGAEPGMAIAICMERSIDLVAGELAVLKAGGAYVPIDLTDPSERIMFMLKDTRASIMLSHHPGSLSSIPEGSRLICLNDSKGEIDSQSSDDLPDDVSADSAAYIMYTSGSTGRPKGVVVNHRGIVRLVINTNYVDIKPDDTVSFVSNPMFDTSTFDVWAALLNGARMVVFDKEIVLTPADFAKVVEREHITVLFLTTQLLNLFSIEIPGTFRHVRDVLFAGEAADASSVRRILKDGPPGRLINVYGPTENTTFSTWYLIRDAMSDNIPIGRPISNSTAYILDKYMQPMPIGVTGEIYLGGDGLAAGYYERPDMTAASFIPDPFNPGEKLYRTGDLACHLPDGNIRFLGRFDAQVKIRGFRVEPDEIKAVLGTYPSVRAALVTAKEVNGEKRLVAHLMTGDEEIDIEGLREYARKKLPEYMVPAHFIAMKEFPMTPTGKVDYRVLPVPGAEDHEQRSPSEGPRDDLERELTNIWAEVLGVSRVGIDDNFFDIGGHSLAAVRMFAKIETNVGVKLPISMIFTSPTIRLMSKIISDNNKSQLWQCLVPLKPDGAKPSLFCVHTISCTLGEYNSLVKCLNIKQSIYGLQPVGLDGSHPPHESVEAMAAHYVNEIRAFQPQGPYLLMGYSSGGVIAYEMARQLRGQGYDVAILCLIEPYLMNRNYYDLKRAASIQSLKTLAGGSITVLMHLMHIKTTRTLVMPPMMDNVTTSIPYRISRALSLNTPIQWRYIDWGITISESHLQVAMRNNEAFITYLPVKHKGNGILFISQSIIDELHGTALGWEKLIGDKLEIICVPGDHISMMQPPNVETLARNIERSLEKALNDCPPDTTVKVRVSERR